MTVGALAGRVGSGGTALSLLSVPNEDELDQIEGWLSVAEGQRLAYLASMVPTSLAIVELGSWKGKSTAWLASGSKLGHGAQVYAADHWTGSPEIRHLYLWLDFGSSESEALAP